MLWHLLTPSPPSNPDGYHSCYVLAGLGSAQTKWHYLSSTDNSSTSTSSSSSQPTTTNQLTSGFEWEPEPIMEGEAQVYNEADRVEALDPVFVVPVGVAKRTRAFFERRGFRGDV